MGTGMKRCQAASALKTPPRISPKVSPSNAARAVSISYNTHPNAHTSVVRSVSLPFACSGDMYAAVPKITPGTEAPISVGKFESVAARWSSKTLANPKSSTFTFPLEVNLMLAGFKSR